MGAMIPENPVVGGTVLRRAAIESPNFATGATGWAINQDGSAEFNNVVIRSGQIISGTALYYSTSPPAAGKLIASDSGASGFDPYGNQYIQGVTAYLAGPPAAAISLQGRTLQLWTAATQAGPYTAQGQLFGDNAGNTDLQAGPGGSLFLNSPTTVTGGLTADTELISGSQANAPLLDVLNAANDIQGLIRVTGVLGANTTAFLVGRISGDTNPRISIDCDPSGNERIRLGSGAATPDVLLQRLAANVLTLGSADLDIATVGRGLRIAEGTNARQGTATLVAGQVTVSNASITANTRIYLGAVTPAGSPGALFVSSVTVGTGFHITSSNGADTSTVSYFLVEKG